MKFSHSGKWETVITILVALAFAIVYGASWWTSLTYPRAIEYEGPMFWAAHQLSCGLNIYDPARLVSAPWAVITYPPVFMAWAGILMKLFGPAFWCLRIVTVVAVLVCAFALFRLVKLAGSSNLVSAIAPAFFLGFSPCFLWSNVGRPDMLAVAFSLLGLERTYVAFLGKDGGDNATAPCVVAGLMLALAVVTKQTSLVCLATSVLFLLWCKQVRLAGLVAAVCAGAGLVMTGLTQLLSGGFLQNISIFGHTPWDSDMLVRYMHFMNDSDQVRIEILASVLIYCFLIRKQETTLPERMPYILTGLSIMQMIYIMGLPGSNGNHAIMPFLALSWWLALKARTLPALAARGILLSSMTGLPVLLTYVPSLVADLPKPESDLVLNKLDLKDQSVLSEDPYLNFVSHSQPAMIDCAVFTSVWKNQSDKLEELKQAIAQKRYAAVILNAQDSDGKGQYFWPESVIATVKQGYVQSGKLAGNGVTQTLWLPIGKESRTSP